MKKFFSLLLALTMVLSLVVVPAEATDSDTVTGVTLTPATASIEKGATQALTLDVSAARLASGSSETPTTLTPGTHEWSSSNDSVATVSNGTVTAVAVGSATITCVAKFTYGEEGAQNAQQTLTATITVTDSAGLKAEIGSITFCGRAVTVGSKNYYFTGEDTATARNWVATCREGATNYADYALSCAYSSGTLTVTAHKEGSTDVTATYSVPMEQVAVTVTPASTTISKEGSVTLSASAPSVPGATAAYQWSYNVGEGTAANISGATGSSVVFSKNDVTADTNYTVICKVTYTLGEGNTKEVSGTATVAVKNETYAVEPAAATSKSLAKGNSWTLPAAKLYKVGDTDKTAITTDVTNAGWVIVSGNSVTLSADKTAVTANTAGTTTLQYSATYRGKTYKSAYVTVSVVALDCALNATTNGASASYYSYAQLASAAQSKIAAMLGTTPSAVTISSMSIKGTPNACGGAFTLNSGTFTGNVASNSYIYYTPSRMQIGTASFVLTVVVGGSSYDVTFTIPVTPIAASFEAQYPQATSANTYGRNYIYTITPPTGYDRFYVVNKTGVAPTDFSAYVSYLATGATSTALYDTDFVNGQCTLYVIAWNSNFNNYYGTSYSYGKYYSGPLTVYQNSTDIEYTAVAGDTVKFKNNDFTNFLNEITKPATTTNTVNSSYYSFSHVTFSTFSNSNQGTLYYGSTAMGTYGKSSFNAATQITDPAQVSFVVKDNTTSKQIVINFTLYADRYSRTGTKLQDDVAFPGRVVIDVVREDVMVTVSPGDVVTLNAGDFLSYLNGYSNTYRNATIDYVTFDQSALTSSTSAPGALYPYYNSVYSYSSTPVKSTDRFYYSARTTVSAVQQLTLGNVVFRTTAPAYTMVGETVYIPFTIKLANSNNTLPGTLAVKLTQAMNFTDVKPGQYYYDAVKWAVGKQITQGMTTTTFGPDTDCTRAQIVTFLWRAAGCPTPKTYYSNFVDVYAGMGSDYYQAILWAVGEGITTGTDTTHFSPNASCTRAQIVTFLWRYAGKQTGYAANYFTDVNANTHSAYYQAILWATNKNITSGVTTTTFGPEATCTRGHAVTFLYRLSNLG